MLFMVMLVAFCIYFYCSCVKWQVDLLAQYGYRDDLLWGLTVRSFTFPANFFVCLTLVPVYGITMNGLVNMENYHIKRICNGGEAQL